VRDRAGRRKLAPRTLSEAAILRRFITVSSPSSPDSRPVHHRFICI
jgi:hypothetical protein